MSACFLCNPDPALVYWRGRSQIAISGLGPIVPHYTVFAAAEHLRSFADGPSVEDHLESELETLRSSLSLIHGSCLVAEHGRLPVCIGTVGSLDPHCLHAHALMFPGAPGIEALAARRFREADIFDHLGDALQACLERDEEYYLLSEHPKRFVVFHRPLAPMRQLTRVLVAVAVGRPDTADWRKRPAESEAIRYAAEMRALMKGEASGA